MKNNSRETRTVIVAALAVTMFTVSAAQAAITLSGDNRFLSASAEQIRPTGSSFSGPFTRTPAFGADQFGSVSAGVYRNNCEIYARSFQDSMVRSDFIKAAGNFEAGSLTPAGFTGTAKVVNRVEFTFTLNAGDFWQIRGTSSGNGFFEFYDPNGTLLLANSGIIGGAAITTGTYRLVAGDNANGNGQATTSGGQDLFGGAYDVRFEIIPTPGTVALGGIVSMMTLGTRRRRN